MSKEPKKDGKKKILIVEDSPDFADLLTYLIDDIGYEGVQFPLEHEDFVGWVKECKPAVILMDLALRRKNGMQFIDDLKAETATKHIPIIIITGRDLNQKEVLALQLKDVKYLRKGRVEMSEVKKAIAEALLASLHAKQGSR